MSPRNRYLLVVFMGYVGLIIAFAFVYATIHKSHPLAFHFASDIEDRQRSDLRVIAPDRLDRASALSHAVALILATNNIEFVDDLGVQPQVTRSDLPRAVVTTDFVESGGTGRATSSIDILAEGNRVLRRQGLRPDERVAIPELLETWLQAARSDSTHFAGVLSDLDYSHIWTYWDFLYFSAMTQATVGYGDILPNSTTIRLLVVLQVLLGVTLLGVVINATVRPSRTEVP